VWVATTFLAVLLATAGLYGICAQFGLVGRRPAPAAAATSAGTRAKRTGTVETVDWDDDV